MYFPLRFSHERKGTSVCVCKLAVDWCSVSSLLKCRYYIIVYSGTEKKMLHRMTANGSVYEKIVEALI